MNVLIVEDDQNKSRQIAEQLRKRLPAVSISESRSFQSGMKNTIEGDAEIVIMDMTLPTFDILPNTAGGETRAYAGRDIIHEMDRRGLRKKVIVVTQYETFHDKERGQVISLAGLRAEMDKAYPSIYVAAIFYNASEIKWANEFDKAIETAIERIRSDSSSDRG